MIKARFLKSDGLFCGFEVSGHAGYAQKGSDIVCAAVSSAVQMTANTVTEILRAEAAVSDVNGTIILNYPGDSQKKAVSDVIAGLHLHLGLLAEQYKGTIRIENRSEDSEVS